MSLTSQAIKQMPKVDLHLHLLGSFRLSDLWTLCNKYHPEITKEEFENKMSFKDFAGFSAAWKFKNSLIRTLDDFSFLVKGFIQALKDDNVIYVEPAIALFEFENREHLNLPNLNHLDLLKIAYNELKASGIEFSFIMDLIRGDGYKELESQYEFYKSVAQKYQIRGVGLAGNEGKHGLSDDLIPLFSQAKKDGFGITIHAGEELSHSNITMGF